MRRRRNRRYRRDRRKKRSVLGIVGRVAVFIIGILILALNTIQVTQGNYNLDVYAETQEAEVTEAEAESPEETETVSEEKKEPVDLESLPWYLQLVNGNHPIDDDYSFDRVKVGNGHYFDERAVGYLEAMLADAKEEGLSPVIVSGYRSRQRQTKLFQNKINALKKKGYTQDEAEAEARTVVAYPGTSEHELGLAVDIVSKSYKKLEEGFEKTAEAKWLAANCADYGFILRYPKDKTEITGIIYEPWHFRYVGRAAARKIMDQEITLEEYLGVDESFDVLTTENLR